MQTRSDAPAPEFLLFLPPNPIAQRRLAEGLASEGIYFEELNRGLRVAVGEADWRELLEDLAQPMSEGEKRELRIALVPRDADDRATRKAMVLAKSFAEILENYSDAWLCELLHRKGLLAHLQPLVQYPPGRIHGYELLLRGVGASEQLLPPARLFESARRLEMTYLLDQQASKAAIAAAAEVGFSNIQYFINIMPEAIDDAGAHAQRALAAAEIGGLRADQITFELVDAETCLDRRRLGRIIERYRDAGFKIALDDVGAGGASILPLKELGPDYIKLDGGLCRSAAGDASQGRVFKNLLETARREGIIVVAKGIETEEQLRFVIDAGVRVTQGHIHAHAAAMPLESSDEDYILRQVRRTAILAID